MINRKTISKCRIYDETNRCWSKEPITVYPGETIAKQGHTIQWYTGVVDQLGVPIYEGDIVKSLDKGMSVIFDKVKYTRGVITWLREAFCVCQSYVGGNEMSNYVHCSCCGCELIVIGNIFDNPELLEDDPMAKEWRQQNIN